MARFFVAVGFVVVTALGFAAATDYEEIKGVSGYQSRASVAGLRVVSVGSEEPAWLSVGGTGALEPSVLLVGVFGVGVVSIGFYTGGILFSTGQIAVGLFAIGQLSIGLIFVICQLGGGLTGFGQVLAGGLVAGQGTLGGDGEKFLERLSGDVNLLLSWKSRAPED